jgi:biopolymer transport protein ExbD
MLNDKRPLSQTMLHSALASTSRLRPSGHGRKRSLAASLMLTSLVDAFSILVIFLIMQNSASQDVVNVDKIQLPTAMESGMIAEGVTVRIEAGGIFKIEEKSVRVDGLLTELKALSAATAGAKKESLIIVGDRAMDYEALSPVILAGSQAGFTKFKFAVIKK